MDPYRRPERFLDELNRTRIIILHRFSEMKTVLFERERRLLKELDIIQSNFEIQLNIYQKRSQTSKEYFASMEDIKIDSSFENIYPKLVVEDRKNVENLLPMKKIQFRIPHNIFSTLERLGSIKVMDDNPNTRRKPTYGEERESHLFQLTRRKSKDDFEDVEPVVKNTKEKIQPNKRKLKCENEIWIIPENSLKKVKNNSEANQTEEIPIQFSRKLSPASFQKLCKDAYLSFLTIQAKFFTNIGIDEVSDWLIIYENSITSILKNKFNQSLSQVLLKMQLIVLFSLTNQNTESKSSLFYKLDFCFLFHFLILQSMQRNFQSGCTAQTNVFYLLPLVRILIQWLRHYTEVWSDNILEFCQHKIWDVMKMLVNNLKSLQFKPDEVLTTNSQSFLWEDQLLSGCLVTDKFIQSRMSWEEQQINIQDQQSIAYRIDLIVSDLRILTKLPNFPVRFDEQDGSFNLTNIPKIESENAKSQTTSLASDFVVSYENTFDDHALISDEDEYLSGDSDDNQDEFHILKTEKNRLEAEVNKQTMQINKYKHQQTIIRHEITPKYIVPDTNCYLSHFNLIQQIYLSSYLQLIVPLIVIQELQHLRKPISKSQKHISSCSRAKEAYGWLMDEFSNSERKLFALTNRGNLVENWYKQDFSTVRNQRNDDLILQSCVKLNESWYKASDTGYMKSCVVLLTSDRNLRLKAVTQNLPAKSLKNFLSLMNLSL
ncbi:Telomerase-binding protein EST1A isoform X2 [Oopsacas minuta]|uniref:Telomerase-binding protein EST1A isoform X2 n=1 Tax=Oopsacas minuta TaxID=111878 RepID=A0AAV7JC38_9METZ|nr:Telomerase-binding protein EST1A isoform X2 [Oopsacas minuta]